MDQTLSRTLVYIDRNPKLMLDDAVQGWASSFFTSSTMPLSGEIAAHHSFGCLHPGN